MTLTGRPLDARPWLGSRSATANDSSCNAALSRSTRLQLSLCQEFASNVGVRPDDRILLDPSTMPQTLRRKPRSTRFVLTAGLVAGVAAGLGLTLFLCLLMWLGRANIFGVFLVAALFYVWCAVTFVALFALAPQRSRRVAAATLLACVAAPLVFVQTHRWIWTVRTMALERLAERSQPIVDAILAYEQRHAAPPPDLAALVPEFLPEVPSTGRLDFPSYEYRRSDDPHVDGALAWRLSLHERAMTFGSDLAYRPDESLDRDDDAFRGRMGKWVLLDND